MRKVQKERGGTTKAYALSDLLSGDVQQRRVVEDKPLDRTPRPPLSGCVFEESRTCIRCENNNGLVTRSGAHGYLTALPCMHYKSCKKCSGMGLFSERGPQGFDVTTRCGTSLLHKYAQRVINAKIPNRFSMATWDWYNNRLGMRERMAPLKRWMDAGMPGGLWLGGHPGTGKTMMSSLICLRGITQGRTAMWASLPDLLARQRDSFNDNKKSTESPMRLALNHDLLVLDDVDKLRLTNGQFSEWVDEQVWQLIKEREERDQPTVLTSNTPAHKWCEQSRNHAPLLSRIKGRYLVVNVGGGDARMHNRVQDLFNED